MDSTLDLLRQPAGEPDPWYSWTPMPSLAPAFARLPGELVIRGQGNPNCFGAWCRRVPAEPGQVYRLRVEAGAAGIDDPGLHLTPHIVWRRGDLPEDQCAQDAVRRWQKTGDTLVAEDTFRAPAACDGAEIRLLLRYAPGGSVAFRQVRLGPGQLPGPRLVRLGTMRCCPPRPATPADHIRTYGERIDQLARLGAQLVLLPETANTAALPPARGMDLWAQAESIPGPFCQMLAARARACGCHVAAGLLERDGRFLYNAAVLFDARGELVGRQRKVHPYWPEEPAGISPGDQFAVFGTELGTFGFMICYDSWWPESARALALAGAEAILFPNAGYEPRLLPARAIDNNVYIVAASLHSPAGIVDPVGTWLASSAADGVLAVAVDLNDRPKCHPNAGGNLNSAPGGAGWSRNARDASLYARIAAAVSQPV